jgi:hypothetical protein
MGIELNKQIREIELELSAFEQRLCRTESEINFLKNPPDRVWMSAADVDKHSGGKYRAKIVREKIQQAIDFPADSPFKLGDHYTIDLNERGRAILVNYPEFDRLMVIHMQAVAFG